MPSRISLPQVTDCHDCGACCTEQGALPITWFVGRMQFGNPQSLPPELKAELEQQLRHFIATEFPPDGSHCVWYDTDKRQCKHHEFRPELCREFEVGGKSCHAWRQRKGIEPRPVYRMVKGKIKYIHSESI